MATIAHRLELDLDVFAGPFDLLLSLILREELDLLEVELAEVVLAYVDHLEAEGELDLEAATEFLVLIAALLELKSRLMLPGDELPDDLEGLEPAEAAEELLERMLQYARFRGAGRWVAQAHAAGRAYLHRSAPLPPGLRRVSAELAERAYDPAVLGHAIGSLLRTPPPIDLRHMEGPRVAVADRLAVLRRLLARGPFAFDDAVEGADRVTEAVTLFALLELYKRGEATWEQAEPFGPITVESAGADSIASSLREHRGEAVA
jgi:segregation and condensation protein A